MATQGSGRARARRYLPPRVWEPHHDEIKRLYVTAHPSYSLERLMGHMWQRHGFDASCVIPQKVPLIFVLMQGQQEAVEDPIDQMAIQEAHECIGCSMDPETARRGRAISGSLHSACQIQWQGENEISNTQLYKEDEPALR